MRPNILDNIFAPVTSLPGIGPRFGKLLEEFLGPKQVDLLFHLPAGVIDRRFQPTVRDAPEGRIATLTVTVEQHFPSNHPKRPYRVRCRDATGFLHLVYFHVKGDYLTRLLPVGSTRIVSGKVERFNNEIRINHPDYIAAPDARESVPAIEPIYGLTAGLPLRTLQKGIAAVLAKAPDLAEWIDPGLKKQRQWPDWKPALLAAHAPQGEADLSPTTAPRTRLAYDELLASQLAILLLRAHTRRLAGRAIKVPGKLRDRVTKSLPFSLTNSQRQAIAEIAGDMAAPNRMLRLLQGDVGSGKTVVALMAMLDVVEAGSQAALMAPTEILARQHYATLIQLAEPAGVGIALLTGREKGKTREDILLRLASGDIGIVVGTHALFSEDVAFKDLALAVIDEQHRFGVEQRIALSNKGKGVDILVMTATPIPRTLMLTAYGDLDSSRLTEKPAGRKPVATRTVPLNRLDDVIDGVKRALDAGAKIYWICPLVEESEQSDLAAAEERFATLKKLFGDRVGLVHGKLKGAEKDRVMESFAHGPTNLLVATTVIEVGVDVPDATVMVIEHAERFGLAQLHQLRGRIGRGAKPSSCVLLYATPLTETAKARLAILRETEDGFRIADEDLRLRGAGEVLGTRQSGMPEMRLVDLAAHGDLIPVARDDARLALERDPELKSERGAALRTLLYLFERDQAAAYLRSG
ncbi:MAG TPA: ATP-dependent DNA helicase RecG [Stellaceae bacterium]